MRNGDLCLAFIPVLPGWLFDDEEQVTATFLGTCAVVYHNPEKHNTFGDNAVNPIRITLTPVLGQAVEIDGPVIGAPYAEQVRSGKIKRVDVYLQ